MKKLRANVQPHSGPQANMAGYFAFLELGDTVLGMDLACGGHLTHGSPVSFSGKFYNFVHYGVKAETGTIDYDEVAELARKHRPKMIVAGASAYPRINDFNNFANIARDVGAFFGRHGSHCRPGGCRSPPIAGTGGGSYYQHTPQDPAGSPRRLDPGRG